jgi:hypothetical protein
LHGRNKGYQNEPDSYCADNTRCCRKKSTSAGIGLIATHTGNLQII